MNVDLTQAEAQYLAVLAATDLRRDRERHPDSYFPSGSAVRHVREYHQSAWEKLQAACDWEHDDV